MPPAPNRIHSLPVLVHYHLPSSPCSFTTLFSTPQQVYIHANAVPHETWGSIYLKTIAQGILMASPELSFDTTLDPSLYILDPRETCLRRQRAPDTADVWAGKGLLSWALAEAGQGKNLITGRLVYSSDFAATKASPLEALASGEGWWGIQVDVSIRDTRVRERPQERIVERASATQVERKPLATITTTTTNNLPSIPSALYHDPNSLTKDQARRLLDSPAFLELLERTARPEKIKAKAASPRPAKRVKLSGDKKGELKCWNCGRTKSSVWRSRTMEDGSSVRVCNACGLYWNARKEMRPPSLWAAIDDEVPERPIRQRKPVIRHTPTFKRTLSAAVNEDAKRIASTKRSGLSQVTVQTVKTSPPRPITHAPKPHPQSAPAAQSPPKHPSSDTTQSNLFQSSPDHSPFDFSALPPSSPPVLGDALHSGFMSSPDEFTQVVSTDQWDELFGMVDMSIPQSSMSAAEADDLLAQFTNVEDWGQYLA